MVKVHTIEMLEHSSRSTPNVKAHTNMINGSLVGLGDGVTIAPADGKKLYIVMNVQNGDKEYADSYEIAKDTYVNLYDVSSWDGKELDITSANLVGDYVAINVGDTLTFDADTFKFTAGTGTIKFTVTNKFGTIANGLRVKIEVA